MADTIFSSGTVIASSWLNDVNKKTYRESISALSLCTGNGTTDETVLLQQIFDLVPLLGTVVYLPTGYTFLVSDTITIKSNTKVTGGGTIKLANASNTHLIENENYASGSNEAIVLDGIILDGNVANQTNNGVQNKHGVHMKNVTSLLVKNCEIKNVGADCINLIGCNRPVIFGNHMHGAYNHAVTFEDTVGLQGKSNIIHDCGSKTDATGITAAGHAFIGVMVQCDHAIITDNYIYDMGDSCIRNERAGHGWVVANNLIVNSGKDSIKVQGPVVSDTIPEANVVSGNSIIDAGCNGIVAIGHCVVTGNYIFGTGKNTAGAAANKWFPSASGIITTDLSVTTNDYTCLIANNVIRDGLYAGIYVSGPRNVTVRGNVCYRNGQVGIVAWDCDDIIIENNRCVDNGAYSSGNGYGIRASLLSAIKQDHISIRYNTCSNVDTTDQLRGILVSGATANYLRVQYNDVRNNASYGIYVQATGTSNVISHNDGFATEAQGTATVPNGATSILVNHGLSVTPTSSQISITPTNNLGSATKFWLSSISSSQIQISVDVNPGATTATFAWQVV